MDQPRDYPDAHLHYTRYCHLLADTRPELTRFARAVGMPDHALQDHPWRWHYDLPAHLRPRALELGAVELTMHEVGALLRRHRAEYAADRAARCAAASADRATQHLTSTTQN